MTSPRRERIVQGIEDRDLFSGTAFSSSEPVRVEGVVERIIYANEESAWKVLRLSIGSGAQVVAVGTLPGVQPGETLRLEGSWQAHPKFGTRLKVNSYTTLAPSTLVGIEKYLASGLIHGIGRELAARIVRRFGLDTLRVIDEEGGRLTEVEGIGEMRARSILQAWQEQREIQSIMVFLQTYGISTGQALRIYRQYGNEARRVIQANPYRLAEDIFGIGFKTADGIAANLGLSRTSAQRAEAGLLHALGEFAEEGHLYVPRDRLLEVARSLLEADEGRAGRELLERGVEGLLAQGRIVAEEDRIYLRSLHAAEMEVARNLAALAGSPASPLRVNLPQEIAVFERQSRIELSAEQREAVGRCISSRILVITGGPGTGKTTLIRAILEILQRAGLGVELAAPTGRAAKRMEEACGRPAQTLHRLLEFRPREGSFARDREHPLKTGCLVVDEVSMVDVYLFAALLRAVSGATRLILVGDADQLPSVGPGSILRDLILSARIPVAGLKRIFRQAEESRITVNAHRILSGHFPLMDREEGVDFFFIRRTEPEEILQTIKYLVSTRIPQRFGIDPREDLQVLTPMYKGLIGATNLNAELQALLNPRGEIVGPGRRLLRRGDRVMQVRNNYELEVFNGDVGRIAEADAERRWVEVRFDDRTVRYGVEDLDELSLAYACSIHKAQGSEYPAVVIPLHTQHAILLRRNLLYTAVTRGRKLVVVVGSMKALAISLKQDRLDERYSRLARRLAELLPG